MQEITVKKFMFCKIGSICGQKVQVDMRKKTLRVGEKIRIKENYWENGSQWSLVYVDKIDANGVFFASK